MQSIRKLFSHQITALRTVYGSGFHTTALCQRGEDRKEMKASMPAKDEGTEGEKNFSIDQLIAVK